MAGYNESLLSGLVQAARLAPVLEDQAYQRQQRLVQAPIEALQRQAQQQTLAMNMASAPEKAALDMVMSRIKAANEAAPGFTGPQGVDVGAMQRDGINVPQGYNPRNLPAEQAQATMANAQSDRGIRVAQLLDQFRRTGILDSAEKVKEAEQTRKAGISAASGNVVPPEHADLHGDQYLATLPQATQNNIKLITSGKATPQQITGRSQDRAPLMAMAAQYDPQFNTGRGAVIKDFTSGPTSKNVTAINTALAHIGTMDELSNALENKDLRLRNAIINRIRAETGDESINNFDTAKQAVANELMRVFRQVQASEQETKEWETRFSSANSPSQIKGALRTAGTLLRGRIDAVNDQWDRGMGVKGGYPDLLAPRTRDVLTNLGVKIGDSSVAPQVDTGGWSIRKK